VSSLEIVPGRGGVFEVTVDVDLVYSKKATGRHAKAGEVMAKIRTR
jgi:selT/selW/selH-like putative selenoprotein